MEVDAKIKELEDEFKVLKAEIRNVLLDIREVILERSNPLAEEHESAFIRMDLNTTARAMASEAVAKEAMNAGEGDHEVPAHTHEAAHPDGSEATDAEDGDAEAADDAPALPNGIEVVRAEDVESSEEAEIPEPIEASDEGTGAEDDPEDAPAPKVVKRQLRKPSAEVDLDAPLPTEIPPMYQADPLMPLSGTITISEWLTEALSTVGPHELERIIAIHRLWGNMPPNISRALAYLQELLNSSEESDPPWLKVMQDLDRLAAL